MKKIVFLLLLLTGLLVPWATQAQTTPTTQYFTVYENETVLSNESPMWVYNFDDYTITETVFPAEDLAELTGKTITELRFYTAPINLPYNTSNSNVRVWVYLKEVSDETVNDFTRRNACTTVFDGYLNFVDDNDHDGVSSVVVQFNGGTGFDYHGGNLLVGCQNQLDRGWRDIYFYGKYASQTSIHGKNSSSANNIGYNDRQYCHFLPRTTFTYVDEPSICPKPTHLIVNETSTSGTEVSISWEENGTATSWQICLNDDETNLITANVTPYTLTALTTETPYTVKVRAFCSTNDQSSWSEPITFMPTTKTHIGYGTATHNRLPFATRYRNNSNPYYYYSLTEQIYTTAELGEAGTIQSIDFYRKDNSDYDIIRNLDIYMISTTLDGFGWQTDRIPVTQEDLVFSGPVTFANNVWTTISLTQPFEYNGVNNVVILVDDNTGNSSNSCAFLSFIGANSYRYYMNSPTTSSEHTIYYASPSTNYDPTATDEYQNSGNDSYATDCPKNQIRIVKGDPPSCFRPIDLNISNIGATQATLSWSDANSSNSWEVQYSTSSDFSININAENVTSNPAVISSFAPGTIYYVRVRAICDPNDHDDGMSQWSSTVRFTTKLCNEDDMCWISCELFDNGFGWDEASINIIDVGTDSLLSTWTYVNEYVDSEEESLNTAPYTDGVEVCPSRPIRFEWQNGNGNIDESNLSYYIYDINNREVFSGTGPIDEPFVYTVNCNESECTMPEFDVELNGSSATVEWEGDEDVIYNIYLNGTLRGSDVESPYMFENLELATNYSVQLEAVCDDGPSIWTLSRRFTTDICTSDNQCTISYRLYDDDGLAMCGGGIRVLDATTNRLLDTWHYEWDEDEEEYEDSYSASGSLSVCDGRDIRFEWSGNDCSNSDWTFVVTDVNGEETVINMNELLAEPVTYSVDCYVTSCHKPTGLAVNYEGGNTATLVWNTETDIDYNISVNGTIFNSVESPYTLNNLSLATLYEVKLQADCGDEVSQWVKRSFVTDFCTQDEMCEIQYELEDTYGDGWNGNGIMVVDVTTEYNYATLTIENGETTSGTLRVCNNSEIVFRWMAGSWPEECSYTVYDVNGEELFSGNGPMYEEVHYTPNCLSGIIDANGWYAISAPYYDEDGNDRSIGVANVEGLIPTETGVEYDLFRYNESLAKWENQKGSTETGHLAAGFTTLDCGRGYIYRRSANTILSFDGTPYAGPLSQVQTLTTSFTTDENLKGFNLIGNPYQQPIYKGVNFDYDISPSLVTGFYSLRSDGSWIAHTDDDAIAIGEGVLVKVSGSSPVQLSFYDESEEVGEGPIDDYKKGSAEMNLQFDVKGCGHEDVAYAMLNAQHSEGLPKIAHLNAELPSLSIPQGSDDYAIAMIDGSTQAFPLKFRSIVAGEFTLTMNTKSVFGYLHLVDKVANRDIDLLRQPTYTFAHTGNQALANRFMVKLRPEGENTVDIFAYQNDDRIVVEGTGALQVYDVLGRQLFAHEIESQFSILNSQFPSTGVYILRLNGKSQKIVIK